MHGDLVDDTRGMMYNQVLVTYNRNWTGILVTYNRNWTGILNIYELIYNPMSRKLSSADFPIFDISYIVKPNEMFLCSVASGL